MFRPEDTPPGEVEQTSLKCTHCEVLAAEAVRKDAELARLRSEIEALNAEIKSRDFVATM